MSDFPVGTRVRIIDPERSTYYNKLGTIVKNDRSGIPYAIVIDGFDHSSNPPWFYAHDVELAASGEFLLVFTDYHSNRAVAETFTDRAEAIRAARIVLAATGVKPRLTRVVNEDIDF